MISYQLALKRKCCLLHDYEVKITDNFFELHQVYKIFASKLQKRSIGTITCK